MRLSSHVGHALELLVLRVRHTQGILAADVGEVVDPLRNLDMFRLEERAAQTDRWVGRWMDGWMQHMSI